MDTLPVEIVVEIFAWYKTTEFVTPLRLVCRHWRNIINTHYDITQEYNSPAVIQLIQLYNELDHKEMRLIRCSVKADYYISIILTVSENFRKTMYAKLHGNGMISDRDRLDLESDGFVLRLQKLNHDELQVKPVWYAGTCNVHIWEQSRNKKIVLNINSRQSAVHRVLKSWLCTEAKLLDLWQIIVTGVRLFAVSRSFTQKHPLLKHLYH